MQIIRKKTYTNVTAKYHYGDEKCKCLRSDLLTIILPSWDSLLCIFCRILCLCPSVCRIQLELLYNFTSRCSLITILSSDIFISFNILGNSRILKSEKQTVLWRRQSPEGTMILPVDGKARTDTRWGRGVNVSLGAHCVFTDPIPSSGEWGCSWVLIFINTAVDRDA